MGAHKQIFSVLGLQSVCLACEGWVHASICSECVLAQACVQSARKRMFRVCADLLVCVSAGGTLCISR